MKFCSLSSSSYANCVVVQDENTCILIDCGLRKRDIKPFLNSVGLTPGDIDAVLITHSHNDHVYGLKHLLAEKNMPVYSTGGIFKELTSTYTFKKTPNLLALNQKQEERINSMKVTPFRLSHDVETIGFMIGSGSKRLGFLTDTGFVPEDCLEALQSVDYLYIEANHDFEMYKYSAKPYYVKKRNLGSQGHLSNDQCGQALKAMGLKKCELVVLAHLSEDDNEPNKALETVRGYLPRHINLVTAPARTPGGWSDLIGK